MVQLVGESAAREGEALIVMEKVCPAVAPRLSCTVTLPLENVPADVGVPVNDTVLPLTTAVRPVGRPLAANNEYGAVPPLIAIAPENPERFTVQVVDVSAPRESAGPAETGGAVTSVAAPTRA